VVESAIHTAADGKRYLVIHGDVFDVVVCYARWLALLGRMGLRNRACDQDGCTRRL
jgi:UDP-2,3-diacylglucosamine pyrophosphatase LpxH